LLKIRVTNNGKALSRQAADLIFAELERRPDMLFCASAGRTPTETYRRLAALRKQRPKPFIKMRVLQIDEWGGVSPGNAASCHTDLTENLLKPLGIERNRFCGFRGDAPDERAECRRVARWLQRNGPIDLCLLGLGANGHLALNEPGEALNPHAHVARLAESSRNHSMLTGLKSKPRLGLTLGMADILASRKILLLVSGTHKRPALKRALQSRVTTRFPASFLWLHPDVTVICDRPAAGGRD
jgi:galactosamine-6-phosphate isomerase